MKNVNLMAILLLLIFFACSSSEADNEYGGVTGGYAVGDTARDFRLKNVNGQMVSLADYQEAKGYIVIFTCNTCPFSKMYEDRIKALHTKFAAKGYPVIAINPNDARKKWGDSFDNMIERAQEKGFKFPYVQDKTQEIARAYGATNTPHVYVLNKDREVVYIGSIDNNARDAASADKLYVEDAIEVLENNKSPEITKTKAIGCTIKWAS
ncbi:thioredoxin family protein [Pontibacter sp. FD36]|uniref:thioredoxin family protein n=1 Tax=Pontibacter sp. FD36 TaxID=2789860 RepID=UPI0018AB5619|nr:thioredoxin family protein [Pontibacter sp. FD36]MBF8962142.1 thioredoxin family protein [Pontibacter sp. FD36]